MESWMLGPPYFVGERVVYLHSVGPLLSTVRWLGRLSDTYGAEMVAGIELHEERRDFLSRDGHLIGKRKPFECPPFKGLYTPINRIVKEEVFYSIEGLSTGGLQNTPHYQNYFFTTIRDHEPSTAPPLPTLRPPLHSSDNSINNKKISQKSFRAKVNLYIEDDVSTHGPINVSVDTSCTIAQMKKLIEDEFEIPIHVQRLIVGNQLALNEDDTLSKKGINRNGCNIYLFIMSKSAHKEKQAVQSEPILEPTEKEENEIEILPPPPETRDNPQILPPIQEIHNEEEQEKQGVVEAAPEDEDEYEYEYYYEGEEGEEPEEVLPCKNCAKVHDGACEITKEADKVQAKDVMAQYQELDNLDLIPNAEMFECLICYLEIEPGDGVMLRECLHTFCKECLIAMIENADRPEIICPYKDDDYSCEMKVLEREMKGLVSKEVFEKFQKRSLQEASAKMENSYHCKTPDCPGFCVLADDINNYKCDVCKKVNCITCQAIHEGMDCKEYQRYILAESTDENSIKTREWIDGLINSGDALYCPNCQVLLLKKWGCDWVKCTYCRTEICWVTKQLRWGPAGKGDTSGGCRCMADGRTKCHPKCNYCH
ncbi:ranBP-type and C3HC4-type zinc finger-containing protein 1 [Lepeophtheirus salmonis]|uniref:ranBP-type and C3HC4-type zinc finger-containing protein 1 n=1 Tax=Lepeophtheirus salmonis TaxID=72036 RepID=UPI001AE37B25|nr:ranBP-type and C3HC4-type zinc finger-containing protein 1-like [Lepeophtheirus salmonis]